MNCEVTRSTHSYINRIILSSNIFQAFFIYLSDFYEMKCSYWNISQYKIIVQSLIIPCMVETKSKKSINMHAHLLGRPEYVLTKPTRSCGLGRWSFGSLFILFSLPFTIFILRRCIHIIKKLSRFDFTTLKEKE